MPLAAQAQYRSLFDNALEAIVVIDAEGVIQSANPAIEQVFGYEPSEIVGRSINLLMPAPATSRDDAYPEHRARPGPPFHVGVAREVEGRHKDGAIFPLELSVTDWQRDGKTFFTEIMRDITDRKEGVEALANREAHLANLYAQSGAGLAETDSTGRFVSVNARYCEIVGRSREELLRLRLHDITHPDDHQRNLPLFARLAANAGPVLIEERYIKGDGSIVWVTKTASPIRTEGAEPIALVVAIDVTERKLAEAALHESEERLWILQNEFAHLARVNDLGEMAVAIAHEINQPLTAITNYLNAGRMVVDDESTAAALATARDSMALAAEQALRAGKIIQGLREFAGKGNGTRRVETADGLVDSAMALALIDIRDTRIHLEHKAAGREVTVEVDPVQIQQVLVNLLRNAIDALLTNPPDAECRLTIATRNLPAKGMVEFCVSDTGPGIAPELCDRLFTPFFTTKAKGLGIGLSVCRRIIESHGGTIEAECGDGIGATFRIRLPRHQSGAILEDRDVNLVGSAP